LIGVVGLYSIAAYLAMPFENVNTIDGLKTASDSAISNSYAKVTALIGITFLLLTVYSTSTLTSELQSRSFNLQLDDDDFVNLPIETHDSTDSHQQPFADVVYNMLPEEVTRQEQRVLCFTKTRKLIMDIVFPLDTSNRNFTATDYPTHWNIGDPLLWSAQEMLWHIYGQLPLRTVELEQRNISAIAKVSSFSFR
jgi:hypothetical protein